MVHSSEALDVFSEWFGEDHPSGYLTSDGDYIHRWTLNVADGVGILRVVVEDLMSADTAEFEWSLNLRS